MVYGRQHHERAVQEGRTCLLVGRGTEPGDLPGGVVAVLLSPEGPPRGAARVRTLGAEDAAGRRVAIGDMDACDLFVDVVVRRATQGVERGGSVSTLGKPADGSRRRCAVAVASLVLRASLYT